MPPFILPMDRNSASPGSFFLEGAAPLRETFFFATSSENDGGEGRLVSREKEGGEPEEAASACLSQNNAGFMEAAVCGSTKANWQMGSFLPGFL